ncbi:Uncharacterized protein HZ326_5033 [Fusarium oxysporum f. sp. albedinis]|nr:Uncharacterized protein HZ326_5033 [Fusarium oxysporum f. sp. albedinis]
MRQKGPALDFLFKAFPVRCIQGRHQHPQKMQQAKLYELVYTLWSMLFFQWNHFTRRSWVRSLASLHNIERHGKGGEEDNSNQVWHEMAE